MYPTRTEESIEQLRPRAGVLNAALFYIEKVGDNLLNIPKPDMYNFAESSPLNPDTLNKKAQKAEYDATATEIANNAFKPGGRNNSSIEGARQLVNYAYTPQSLEEIYSNSVTAPIYPDPYGDNLQVKHAREKLQAAIESARNSQSAYVSDKSPQIDVLNRPSNMRA